MKAMLSILALVALFSACGDPGTPEPDGPAINGTILEKALPASGVDIFIDGQKKATTASDGSFSVTGLAAGDYTLRPADGSRIFFPEIQTATLGTATVTGIDFVRVAPDQLVHANALWDLLNATVYHVTQNDEGSLKLDLASNAIWYQGNEGGLIYRLVNGNFTLTATVHAVKRSDGDQPVECNVCLAGLMARNPSTTNGENYVHIVTGVTPDGAGVETKNTANSSSAYETFPDALTVHQLRLIRSGSAMMLYAREDPNADWVLRATYQRPDLPSTLAVGFNIYTSQAGSTAADLSAVYEQAILE